MKTGQLSYNQVILQDFTLVANCSTEFSTFSLPEASEDSGKRTVAAIYLIRRGLVLARHVNFHVPLKEVSCEHSNNFVSKICGSGKETWLELTATVPVKGVWVEAQGVNGNEVVWGENGVDLVPGEITRCLVKGLRPGDEGRLNIRLLGGQLQLAASVYNFVMRRAELMNEPITETITKATNTPWCLCGNISDFKFQKWFSGHGEAAPLFSVGPEPLDTGPGQRASY